MTEEEDIVFARYPKPRLKRAFIALGPATLKEEAIIARTALSLSVCKKIVVL